MRKRNANNQSQRRLAPKSLEEMLDYLNLIHAKEHYRDILGAAAKDNVSHEEFLKPALTGGGVEV